MEKNQNLMSNKMMVAKDHYIWKWNDQRQFHDYKYGGVGFSSRSYDCSFCKREFRSAQALGGHMNVHRRDRAMLRQHTPPLPPHINILDLNFHPNPNPNFSASPPPPNGCNKLLMGVGLSLEIGHSKEDLDLELRLGF